MKSSVAFSDAYCIAMYLSLKSYPQVIHLAERNWWISLFSEVVKKCYNEVGKSGVNWRIYKVSGENGGV